MSTCGNCGEQLSGDYCFSCGQPRKSPLVSIGQLTGEYMRDVFSLDSRAWRTLALLLFRPGAISAHYLAGRRHAYTPPVRLYLLTSLMFLAIFTLPLLVESMRESIAHTTSLATQAQGSVEEDAVSGAPQADLTQPADATATEFESDECDDLDVDAEDAPPWLQLILRERAERACQLLTAEGGVQRFAEEFLDGLPGMLLAILPLMALGLSALYAFSGRHYVEHLIVLAHYHSFVFLLVGATVVFARLPVWGVPKGLFIAYTSIYTPWYLYRAMRTVYGQGRLLTMFKFSLLSLAYLIGLSVALAIGLLLAVESFTR